MTEPLGALTDAKPLTVRIPLDRAYLEAEVIASVVPLEVDAAPVRVIGRKLVVEHRGGEWRFDLAEGAEVEVIAGGPAAGSLQKYGAAPLAGV